MIYVHQSCEMLFLEFLFFFFTKNICFIFEEAKGKIHFYLKYKELAWLF